MTALPLDNDFTDGLPVLSTNNSYRILTENVQLQVSQDGTVDVRSTTVYRNLGGKTTASISIPNAPVSSSGMDPVRVMWDKQPVYIGLQGASRIAHKIQVPLGSQATHALLIHYSSHLTAAGFGHDQYKFQYLLRGSHPIELFSMSYRFDPGSIFGLPAVKPELGWEIGEKGASIRKENFNPDNALTEIQFYWNSMHPLGKG